MSLEAKIEELTAALKENTAAMAAAAEAYKAFGAAGGDAPSAGAADGEKRGRGRPKKEDAEPAKKEDPKPENKKAAEVSDDKVREVFGAFMGVEDADEREKRKTFVKDLLKGYGVAKALEIPADKREEALQKVEAEGERLAAAGEDDLV